MFCGICICKWKIRNWGAVEFFKAKKFRCMWRSPFAPLLNFLNHEMAYKRFYLERETEPASLATKYPPKWTLTTMAWLGMTSKKPNQPRVEPLHGHKVWRQHFQPDTSQTHCRSSAPLARVAFDCLACAALLPLGKGSILYIAKKPSPPIS